MDGSYAKAKRGGDCVGKSRAGQATRLMALCDWEGRPLAVSIAPGNRHEVPLVDGLLDSCFLENLPSRIVADRAYDSNGLRCKLDEERGVWLIAPRRRSRRGRGRKARGRVPRVYRRRWVVERLFARLFAFRRVATRWERHAENYRGFVLLACMMLLLRSF